MADEGEGVDNASGDDDLAVGQGGRVEDSGEGFWQMRVARLTGCLGVGAAAVELGEEVAGIADGKLCKLWSL